MRKKLILSNEYILHLLDIYPITEFQKKVLIYVMSIKKGETKSYSEIARAIGNPNAYRAVGTALRKNPLPLIIPCHRVIKNNGKNGRYSYGGNMHKLFLLKNEHIRDQ